MMARRVKTKQKGLTARRRTAVEAARAWLACAVRPPARASRSQEAEEDAGKNGHGEGSGGDEGNASEGEQEGFKRGQDGESGGGVEVAGDVPVAELEVADGGVAVPAFVGIFRPVHPGGLVGEVGGEVDGVQGEEEGGQGRGGRG